MWSVKPSTRTRGCEPKRPPSRASTSSLRPHSATTNASGSSSAASMAPSRSPTAQPPPETTTIGGSAGSSSARLASARSRGCANSGRFSPRTGTISERGAIARTSSTDSGWVTRCRSRSGWAQKWSAARSVIADTTGSWRRPRWRSSPSSWVMPG